MKLHFSDHERLKHRGSTLFAPPAIQMNEMNLLATKKNNLPILLILHYSFFSLIERPDSIYDSIYHSEAQERLCKLVTGSAFFEDESTKGPDHFFVSTLEKGGREISSKITLANAAALNEVHTFEKLSSRQKVTFPFQRSLL